MTGPGPAAARRAGPFHAWPGGARELTLFACCGVVVAFQVLVVPFVGLANNGDFPKVAGWLSLGPAGGNWDANFIHFVSDYVRDPRYRWIPEGYSSEIPLAATADRLGRVFQGGGHFDVRWLGSCGGALFLWAYAMFLIALRPLGAWKSAVAGSLLVLVFADVGYVSYLNSFYSDAAALLGLLIFVSAAAAARITPALVGAGLFVASKPQHALFALVPIVLLLALFRNRRKMALAGSAAILVLASATLATFPRSASGQALFNLVFHKLTPDAPARLGRLGLPGDYARFVGMHAWSPGSPADIPAWRETFLTQISYRTIAALYVREPGVALEFLSSDLAVEAPHFRPDNLSNMRKEDGGQPGQKDYRFSFWSGLRMRLFELWPPHVLLVYGLLGCLGVWRLRRQETWPTLVLGCLVLGAGEFVLASLADAAETCRHLFIFHAATDLGIVAGVVTLLGWLAGRREPARRQTSG